MTKLALRAPCDNYDEPNVPATAPVESLGDGLHAYRGFLILGIAKRFLVYVNQQTRARDERLCNKPSMDGATRWIDDHIDEIDRMAGAIFDERCPGIAYLVEDVPLYRHAAIAALEVLGLLETG